jgi:predicted CoA-binding protein
MNEDQIIHDILTNSRNIAVVGLSTNPARASYEVANYMQKHGYRIVPVNPGYAGTDILGERCYATLTEAAEALKQEGKQVDVVDCFRQSNAIEPIAEEAIAIGAKSLWMQLGVINEQAAERASKAGLQVVMDRCIKIEHMNA